MDKDNNKIESIKISKIDNWEDDNFYINNYLRKFLFSENYIPYGIISKIECKENSKKDIFM